jgi:hypothetical protein
VGVKLLPAVGVQEPVCDEPVGPKPVGVVLLPAEPVGELVLLAAVVVSPVVKIDKKEEKRQAAQRAQQDKAEEKRQADQRAAQIAAEDAAVFIKMNNASERHEAEREQRAEDDKENAKDKSHYPWMVVQAIPGMCPYQRQDGNPCESREACHYHMFTMRNLNLPCSGLRESGQRCFNGMPCNKHLLPGMKGFVPGPPGSYGDF